MSNTTKIEQKKDSNKFDKWQFIYFGFNWIVGFGFIGAMSSGSKLGPWSLISLGVAAFIAFAVMLAFANLSNSFPKETGGVYGYATKIFSPFWSFFHGWNQLLQLVLVSAATPLFLQKLITQWIDKNPEHEIYYMIASLVFFILISIVGIFGLKFSKIFLFLFGFFKWLIIFGAFFIIAYFAFNEWDYKNNFEYVINAKNQVSISLITANAMAFIFSFNGFNSLSTITNDSRNKNFKKSMILIYLVVLAFYLITYILFLGIKNSYAVQGFEGIWQKAFGWAGTIIFLIGIVANRISGQLAYAVVYPRILAPLAEQGYLPQIFVKKNKYGVQANATLLGLAIVIVSMTFFVILPFALKVDDSFQSALTTGTIVYIVTYLGAFLVILKRHYKKIQTISIWQHILYLSAIAAIFIVLLFTLFPVVLNEAWQVKHTVMLSSYIGSVAIGVVIFLIARVLQKRNISKLK
ncbi:APC family permease [Candidatus Mycoplasma pogonae]